EIKATRIAVDTVALSYRDVTSRVRQQEQIADSEAQAREMAGRMADLQRVTAALAGASRLAEVLQVMQEQVLAASDADGLMVLLGQGDRLIMWHNTGHRPRSRNRQIELPLDGPSAVATVVRERRPRFFASRAEFRAEFPAGRQAVVAGDKNAWAILPLVSAPE